MIESKTLPESRLNRQNILNNEYALSEIENALGLRGILFEGMVRFTVQQIAKFYEVDSRTIERYLEKDRNEIEESGYEILRGNRLKDFMIAVNSTNVSDMNVGNIEVSPKTPLLGVFSFRALLNIGMLLTESQVAIEVRRTILDIVLDVINQKAGGGTKYINQRDKDFVLTYFKNIDYRKAFTDALDMYVDLGKFKYPHYTDKVYKAIFKEQANEYRKILRLKPKDNVRKSLYSEVLLLISAFEYGFAKALEHEACIKENQKLSKEETDILFDRFARQPHWKPLLDDARQKMASRDLCFRDALHAQLAEYLQPIPKEDFEKFIGSSSMSVEEQLEEFSEVFKRLKEKS